MEAKEDSNAPQEQNEQNQQENNKPLLKQNTFANSLEDLVGAEPEKRNWKGIAFALLTILFVFSLVGIAVFVLKLAQNNSKSTGSIPLELHHLSDKSLQPPKAIFQWTKDGSLISTNSFGEIQKWADFKNNESASTIIITREDLSQYGDEFEWELCEWSEPRMLFKVRSTEDNKLTCVVTNIQSKARVFTTVGLDKRMLLCQPTSNGIVMVDEEGNCVFVGEDDQRMQPLHREKTLYQTYGYPNRYYADTIWADQEKSAFWKSPNGQRAVLARFDDTEVDKYTLVDYQLAGTHTATFPYSKPGGAVTKVSLLSVDTSSSDVQPASLIHEDETGSYLLCFSWVSETTAKSEWVDRRFQARTILLHTFEGNTTTTRKLETEPTIAELSNAPDIRDFTCSFSLGAGSSLTLVNIEPRKTSEGTFMHLNRQTLRRDDKLSSPTWLTSAGIDARRMVGVGGDKVYYLASPRDAPEQQHLYWSPAAEMGENYPASNCMTCGLWEDCTFIEAQLSFDAHSVLIQCQGPAVPSRRVMRISDSGSELVTEGALTLSHPEPFLTAISHLRLADRNFYTVHDSKGPDIQAMLITPPLVDKNYQYPLVVYLPGRTERQLVTSRWEFSYLDYLASARAVFVAVVDTRGSRGYGAGVRDGVYGDLGGPEVEDIRRVVKFFQNKLMVHASNVGLLTEEMGGYTAGRLVQKHSKAVRCVSLLRPVTDLSEFLSASVERYTRQEDDTHYKADAVYRDVTNFDHVNTSIIHDLSNRKVLFEQSARLIAQLTSSNIPFSSQVYTSLPDRDVLRNVHLARQLTEFFVSCLRVVPPS